MIACLGAGRMGRGIAIAFAYAGHDVRLIDVRPRETDAFAALAEAARQEIAGTLATLAGLGLFDPGKAASIAARVAMVPAADMANGLAGSEIVFEGVPEIVEVKRDVLRRVSALVPPRTIIASTTSTILVDDLADAVVSPERFLNAHWLNPAYLVPLVEVSPGSETAAETVSRLITLLEAIGKVPVVCKSSPGYIVPRIQALAMNEAARMVEEGVASASDIDKAVKYGFGFRFAVLGLLEFVDWGGGDILFHASRYLEQTIGHERYRSPDIIGRNMAEGRTGLRDRQGFLNYDGLDIPEYQRERLKDFVDLLRHFGLARAPHDPGLRGEAQGEA